VVARLLHDAAPRVVIVERAWLPSLTEAAELEHVIVVDGQPGEGTLTLADVEGSNPEFDAAGRPTRSRRTTCSP
jgi:hypothetical protein